MSATEAPQADSPVASTGTTAADRMLDLVARAAAATACETSVARIVEVILEQTRQFGAAVAALFTSDLSRSELGLLSQRGLSPDAAKYSYPSTPIDVRIDVASGELIVSVTNQGEGIAPEEIPRLFERFRRTGAARERVRGVGLGLHIAKGFVEAHGGRVWVESVLGRTTTFSFSLPIETAGARAAAQLLRERTERALASIPACPGRAELHALVLEMLHRIQ